MSAKKQSTVYSIRSKIYLKCPLTVETREIFYYPSSTKKPLVRINGYGHIYYHESKKVLAELKRIRNVEITSIPVKHSTAKTSMYGIQFKISQLDIDEVKYVVVQLGGKSKKEVWRRALDLTDNIKEDYGIDLEFCEKNKLDEDEN